MPVRSQIEEDARNGVARGHTEHGNGKGLGHAKHAEAAAADGVYTMEISGVDARSASPVAPSVTSAPVTLADGSTLTTEVRDGKIVATDHGLLFDTDSNNGRLRLNVTYDQNNQIALGDLDTLSFDYDILQTDRTNVTPVIRLIIDADGNLATANDRGELIFEYAYQGLPALDDGSKGTVNIVGGDWFAVQRFGGVSYDFNLGGNLARFSDYADADGFKPADGGIVFDEDSLVLGFSIALGSGNGTSEILVDDLQVGGVSYDFVV